MKKKLFQVVMLSVTLLTVGCRSYNIANALRPNESLEVKIPKLMPIVDLESLEYVFGEYSVSSASRSSVNVIGNYNVNTAVDNNIYGNSTTNAFVNTRTSSTMYKDPSIKDIETYFVRDAQNNICEKSEQDNGYIVCKIVTGESGVHNKAIGVISIMFAGIPSLLGTPFSTTKSGFEVQVDIFNVNKKLVASYTSPYISKKEQVALYYGYKTGDGLRKTSIDAFKACMDDIKAQIKSDVNLVKSLKRTN